MKLGEMFGRVKTNNVLDAGAKHQRLGRLWGMVVVRGQGAPAAASSRESNTNANITTINIYIIYALLVFVLPHTGLGAITMATLRALSALWSNRFTNSTTKPVPYSDTVVRASIQLEIHAHTCSSLRIQTFRSRSKKLSITGPRMHLRK